MALSLDDLKKKKTQRVTLPINADAKSGQTPVPVRKKLMPWDPIPEKKSSNSSNHSEEAVVVKDISADKQGTITADQTISAKMDSDLTSNNENIENDHKNSETPLNAPIASVGDDNLSHTQIPIFSNQSVLEKYRHNTDTIPTQIFEEKALNTTLKTDENKEEYRHNTDTIPTQITPSNQLSGSQSTDTIPTQNSGSESNIEGLFRESTDTIPTQIDPINDSDVTDSTDTIPTQKEGKTGVPLPPKDKTWKIESTDTIPTQTSKEPIKRSKVPTQMSRVPTQYRHNADTEATQVPTQVPTQTWGHLEQSTDTKMGGAESIEQRYRSLRGHQKILMDYISNYCILNKVNTCRTTYNSLADETHINAGSIRTTAKRLRNDGLLEISAPTKGPYAFIEFSLSDVIIKIVAKEALGSLHPPLKVPTQTFLKNPKNTDTSTDTSTDTNASSMYVSNNIHTIHTGNPSPDDWSELEDLNFDALSQWNIRKDIIETFRKNKWKISFLDLQDLMERFIRYFTEDEYQARRKSIHSPYSFFLGCVKAISKGEPSPIADVKTALELEQQIAAQNRLKEMERRRREFADLSKQLDSYRESEFEAWYTQLPDEERIKLVPPTNMAKVGSISYRLLLKSYYSENIWPNIKQVFVEATDS